MSHSAILSIRPLEAPGQMIEKSQPCFKAELLARDSITRPSKTLAKRGGLTPLNRSTSSLRSGCFVGKSIKVRQVYSQSEQALQNRGDPKPIGCG